MEVQLTDFENAAFSVFIVLLSRVILSFDLVLYLPLSKVDENLRRAHAKDAVQTQKFFFRKFIAAPDTSNPCEAKALSESNSACAFCGCDSFEEMTLGEIFNGNGTYFPGLIPLIRAYLEYIQCDKFTFRRVNEYLEFISRRANGELLTAAQWMRKFVRNHPSYRFDSVITEDIAYDLMMACKHVGEGKLACSELLGNVVIDPVDPEDAYDRHLVSHLDPSEKQKLIRRYFKQRNPSVSSGSAVGPEAMQQQSGQTGQTGQLEAKQAAADCNGTV
jgi:glutamate--cysteine ligase catalytic subunit